CHPRTRRLWELVAEGAIGRPLLIEASFCFAAAFDPASRLFDPGLGGGGILDVGCYTVSVARLIAGAACGRPFAEPLGLSGAAGKAPTGVDAFACATLEFEGGLLAQLVCGVGLGRGSELRVTGDSGMLVMRDFWNPPGDFELRDPGGQTREMISTDPAPFKYALEADAVAEALPGLESPCVPHADTLGNMAVLDRWRREARIVYPSEEPDARKLPLTRRTLCMRLPAEIPRASFQGREVSRLVLGCDHQKDFCTMAALADDYFERGGNAFDTAHIYAGGKTEGLLGRWLENRGVRNECFVIVKGAHTPFCDPEHLLSQFEESLGRLRISQADLYMMHRDNPAIPAAEFFDALDSLRASGRARAV
ncbi:MAG: aldo/keto reductase, partial [Terrimicrobiaceae bacterium]|nr:aldo/keto reductase [Terrimicrobiaceae bacterium]